MRDMAVHGFAQSDKTALTALDWIAVILALFIAGGLLAAPILVLPAYEGMFRDFAGPNPALPDLTRLVLKPLVPVLFALLQLLLLLPGLLPLRFRIQRIGWRRFWIVLAFFAGLAAVGLVYLGLQLPIFELADAVKA